MCGICGEFNFSKRNVNKDIMHSMLDVLHHRGPDDEGVYIHEAIGLGHKRLSIIDLDTGRQPMSNEEQNVYIVFNGEIYNFRELRKELKSSGHVFKTKSDTEVILHCYEEHGFEFLKKLHGMFAFAIWDERTRILFCARDRLGKKPFFYAFVHDTFIFASEIKALLKHPSVKKDINLKAIDYYLTYQYIPAPMSIFKDIFALLPAHTLTVYENRRHVIASYWEITFKQKTRLSLHEAEEVLLYKLKEAVRTRMISDVPLGAFLSGGIDSSIIVALMSEYSERPVKTFSIGFEEESFSELSYARQIAKRYHTDHHEFIVKPDAVEILPKLVWYFEQPYADASALPTYYLARETRKYVTVTLTGDGGDENFAGYLRHRANLLADTISNKLPTLLWKSLYRILPEISHQKSLFRYFKRFTQAAGESPARRNLLWHCIFRNELKDSIYSEYMKNTLKGINAYSFMEDVYSGAHADTMLDAVLYTDIKTYLPFDLLVKMDIATMAHSLEARSPFLDHELMEWTATLPPAYKMHLYKGKYILKKCFKDMIPSSILKRRKMGFGVPLEQWFRGSCLNTFMKEALLSSRSIGRGYFKAKAIEKLIQEHEQKKFDHGYRLWSLLMLEMWHQVFIDG